MPFLDLDPAAAVAAPVITDGAPLANFGYTLDQLRSKLKRSLGNREDVSADELRDWINEAYLLIASGLKLKETQGAFTFNTVATKYLYALPQQVQYTTRASIADSTNFPFDGGTPLDKIDADTFRRLPDLADVPESFFVYGNLMVVYPSGSGQAVRVEYVIRPSNLVAPTDCPVLSLEWHRGILVKAKSFAYADLEEWEASKEAQNEYVRFLREIGDPVAEEKTGQYAAFRRVDRMSQLKRYRPQQPREDL